MVLYKLEELDDNYQATFDGDDVKGMDVYADVDEEKVGSVKNILVDESGNFRYLVIDTGGWIFGKQVLLPIGRARIDDNNRRIYATGLTKEQAKALPEFTDDLKIDHDYEESVRGVYRPQGVETSANLDASAPIDTAPLTMPSAAAPVVGANYNQAGSYNYDRDQDLYGMNDQNHKTLKLYQERLVANKTRAKAGEVTIGKHVETQTAQVAVPIEKERVVIERTSPSDAGRVVSPGEAKFNDGEVARVDVYTETPDVRKEAFVREEVRVSKEVTQETATAEGQVRREELDLNTGDNLNVDRR
ncbi:hypothetical protein Cri9333_1146 [Crinalium epipsammum PCC 9333]|uniref:PRC-barrel domain protein n=1 Tax=Crinalium epipsammum PCC 9333 TaxID=1173022 RepID=K9VX34_9CYAN|nr:DUF2382 domain-containing protein [Crinalium epipsammum]AFZ12052.1 hypothetical protein Cri9333_1146 [Crinalium epipsammum PCC 9333]